MISFETFFKCFDLLSYCEIELIFDNTNETYMIVKYEDYVTFARCGEESEEIPFKSFDELASTKTIDSLLLKEDWGRIKDIIIDGSFSYLEDKKSDRRNISIKTIGFAYYLMYGVEIHGYVKN